MTPSAAKRLALVAMVVAAGTAVAREVQATGKWPTVATPIGAFVAAVILTGMADVAPELAGSLAALILVTALLVSADVFQLVARLTGGKTR